MKDIEVVRYLLEEIEKEVEYKEKYEKEKEIAKRKAAEEEKAAKSNFTYWFGRYMPEGFSKEPNKTAIKRNAMMIREICLKWYK